MANTKSAKKRAEKSVAERDRNRALKSRMRTAVKKLRKAADGSFRGSVASVAGPAFGSEPWDAGRVVETPVGTATLTFADGNHASFASTVNGVNAAVTAASANTSHTRRSRAAGHTAQSISKSATRGTSTTMACTKSG